MKREHDIDVKTAYRVEMASNIAKLEKAGADYSRNVGAVSKTTMEMGAKFETTFGNVEYGIATLISGMRQMNTFSDDTIKAIEVAAAGATIVGALVAIYSMWAAVKAMDASIQTVQAGLETAENMIIQNWVGIALALSALGIFYATFKVAEYVGSGHAEPASTSSTVHGGTINMAEPASRRQIRGAVGGVA